MLFDFFEKLFSRFLETLSGFNFWIAIIALAVISFYWWFSGKKKKERPILIRRLLPVFGIIVITVFIIGVYELFLKPAPGFPKGTTGILVARIEGDEDNGIQRDLVSTLNTELRKDSDLKNVQARALPILITEAKGHDYARKMGKECNAKLVI